DRRVDHESERADSRWAGLHGRARSVDHAGLPRSPDGGRAQRSGRVSEEPRGPRGEATRGEAIRCGATKRARARSPEWRAARARASAVDALDPRPHAADDLPGNRADRGRHLARVDGVAALTPDEHHLVAG